MVEKIKGLADPAIDMNYAHQSTLSHIEVAMQATAMSNGNTLLEVEDFDPNQVWHHLSTTTEEAYLNNPELQFEKYKRRVITAILNREAQSLLDIWPDLYLEELAHVIANNSSGLVKLEPVIKRFIEAAQKVDYYTKDEFLVFAIAWINVYRLGVLHEKWVANGNTPILFDACDEEPGTRVARFVDASLKNMESGVIDVRQMDKEYEGSALAAYDHEQDNLLLNGQYYQNPVQTDVAGYSTFSMVIHEMFHSYQDSFGEPMPLMIAEMEAELLDGKANILLFGEDALGDQTTISFMQYMMWFMQREALGEVKSPLKMMLDDYLEPGTVQSQHADFRLFRDELALSEMQDGIPDVARRQELTNLYTQERLFGMFYSFVEQLEHEMAWDVNVIESKEFKKVIRKLYKAIPRQERNDLMFALTDTNDKEYADVFIDYLIKAASHFFILYYHKGEEFAHEFYKNKIQPVFYEQAFPDAQGKMILQFDGHGPVADRVDLTMEDIPIEKLMEEVLEIE